MNRCFCAQSLRMLIVLGLTAISSSACRQKCDVGIGHVGVIRLGDSKDQVLKQLANRYSVMEPAAHGQEATLIARAHDGNTDKPALVVYFRAGLVSIIDSYEQCATPEGIGPGVTLGRALQVYAGGKIAPTDLGYCVWFPPNEEITFLLDQRDVPDHLRNIPDDVFSADNERDILRLANARISAVRVTAR
jgi:hypothetical protein